ncbi:MAG: hypothetical protein KQH57_00845 [Actinomycetales bacterium]|nr:hypothetical protein [Actinomycetales bacterium]
MGHGGTTTTALTAIAMLALAGCTGPTPPQTIETVTVTATPRPSPAPTAVETFTPPPNLYVPDGDYAIVLGDGATQEDAALVAAFIEFAIDPSTVPDGLTFAADGVQLGIMDRVFATRDPSELTSRSAWRIGTSDDLLFERTGPYSALEPVRSWVTQRDLDDEVPFVTGAFEVNVGTHHGCPYAIDGVPAGMGTARQVWLVSIGEYVSCAGGWFAIDLFVVDGAVAAVTVELGSP